jgi:hypothetical protein
LDNFPGSLNTSRTALAGCGTQTSALAFGGQIPPGVNYQTATEEYNGATWASNPTGLNTARGYLKGCGTQTAGLAFGGTTPAPAATGATELYDGTTWTSSPASMNTARFNLVGAGTQTAALAAAGATPSITAATEEWTGAGAPLTQTITVS